MSRLVYGCRFDVPGANAWEATVAPRYQRWLVDRYRKSFGTTVTPDLPNGEVVGSLPDDHALLIRCHRAEEASAFELSWTFPGDHGLLWRNLVRMAPLAESCAVEHRVDLASAEYLVTPAHYAVGAPAVVRVICQQEVLVGEMRVKATVYPLPENGVDQFVGLLEAKQRRLPVVLLTPFANGEPGELDARALADHLAGVAIVAEAATPEATRALSERLGRLGCYDGGVRVYWPGFDNSDDLKRHPLMLGSRIGFVGPDRAARTIERSIFSVAAFRFAPDPRISGIVAAAEAAARSERAHEVVEQGDTTWERYALEMSEQLEAALTEAEMLRGENENLKANQSVLFSFSAITDDEDEEEGGGSVAREPKSVAQAVDLASTDCPHLLFLESSRGSALDSPFKRPGEVYEALSTMDKVAAVWAKNRGSGDLRQMLKDAGLGKRVSNFISQTSKGKWGEQYTFTYEGEPQLFEWHVTLGAGAADTCASIHFLPDQAKGKLVVGHVGRHLTNTKS